MTSYDVRASATGPSSEHPFWIFLANLKINILIHFVLLDVDTAECSTSVAFENKMFFFFLLLVTRPTGLIGAQLV